MVRNGYTLFLLHSTNAGSLYHIQFGGGSLIAARDKMREWHDWYASVNEKWGLERGDDIHETGARHKSLGEHNRELHRENKSLEEELETKRRAVKGLTT